MGIYLKIIYIFELQNRNIMKHTFLTLLILSISCIAYSQNDNPFAEFGYDVLVGTSSKGEYEEFHDQADIVEIGSVLFNTRTNKIVRILDKDGTTIDVSAAIAAMSIDPLCEKYYWISPYVYCANNPLKYVDLRGDSLTIAGKQSEDAMNQLQARAGNSITLSMGDNGNISYTINNDKNGKPIKLKGDAKRLAEVIDHSSINVNVTTRESSKTSTGNLFIGGAFMGNTVTNGSVVASQEVNPSVFGRAETFTGKSGQLMMHEVTEAFEGAKISQKAGVGVGPATKVDADNLESVYSRAHNSATSQPILRESTSPSGRPQWTVKGKVFMVLPLW